MSFQRNPNFVPAVTAVAARRIERAAGVVRDRARSMMDPAGDGQLHDGDRKRASAPGEPPVSQTGELSDSLRTYGPIIKTDQVVAAMGTDLFRLWFLEVGTAHMAPRPLLYPALMASRDDVLRVMRGEHVNV